MLKERPKEWKQNGKENTQVISIKIMSLSLLNDNDS